MISSTILLVQVLNERFEPAPNGLLIAQVLGERYGLLARQVLFLLVVGAMLFAAIGAIFWWIGLGIPPSAQ